MADATIAPEVVKDDKKAKKEQTFYFKAPVHAGLTVQVQKVVKNADGTEQQVVDHQETFTQYYDVFKGDVKRVGYLATTDKRIADICESDDNVVTIDEKEYNKAIDELEKAPVPAV